jgi:hypothetical protein
MSLGSDSHKEISKDKKQHRDLGERFINLDIAAENVDVDTDPTRLLRQVTYQRAATKSLHNSFEAAENKIKGFTTHFEDSVARTAGLQREIEKLRKHLEESERLLGLQLDHKRRLNLATLGIHVASYRKRWPAIFGRSF